MNKIVENNNWANLKEEDGLEGGWSHYNGTEKHENSLIVARNNSIITNKNKFVNGVFEGGFWWYSPDGLKYRSAMGKTKQQELYPQGTFYGKTHSDESKIKIGSRASINQKGAKNSQFGTVWINDGKINKKVKRELLDDYIKNGFCKGRLHKHKMPSSKGTIWVNDGYNSTRVCPDNIPDGYEKGRLK